ncbi:hypothetical protein OS493_007155 [Desmophyllum pertusum]|uniref:Uncharacterized protein n=1 Tax=Desmophyllum pertusum TaxID=174260 RepID=A0A9W9ZFK5_9CNID|nr:hypothetical protein OS493_007155 [Desmophyllum pertusum]
MAVITSATSFANQDYDQNVRNRAVSAMTFFHQPGCISRCPSSCKCEEFGKDQDHKIMVTGEDLLAVPATFLSTLEQCM